MDASLNNASTLDSCPRYFHDAADGRDDGLAVRCGRRLNPETCRDPPCTSRSGRGTRLSCTSQTLGEFRNASTRPLGKNAFGVSVPETDRLARVIERDFELLPDTRELHERWRSLLGAHHIKGVQVHGPWKHLAVHTRLPVVFNWGQVYVAGRAGGP